jgi:propionyl-CoA synthetase
MSKYQTLFEQSVNNPEQFWQLAAENIDWYKPFDKTLETEYQASGRWFSGGQMNTCYNAVDRHVKAGRGAQAAIIYDSPVTQTVRKISYAELQRLTAEFAGALLAQGVKKGDRVIIYMPMVPEALVAMLSCARLGAVHSVVFGGFAANELATRIDDAKPKVILSASCGIEVNRQIHYKPLLDEALDLASHQVDKCIILQRPQHFAKLNELHQQDIDWNEAISLAEPVDCTPVAATDPLYILYTSGTTGQPRGVVRDNGGHAVAMQWSMTNIYNNKPGDVYWAASDIGWVVGHSYICYAPLIAGCTTLIYEGKPVSTPDAGAFWRVVNDHQVKTLFTAPTAIRAIKKEDPEGSFLSQYDTSSLQNLFLAGERSDPDTLAWAEKLLSIPVIDHWWQTETAWAIAGNPMGIEPQQIKHGSAGLPMPGYNVQILDDEGDIKATGEMGNIVVKLPLPPSCFSTLWQNAERFHESYMATFPGYYLSGDSGYIDNDGYVWVMGRIDDVINVAGHRLSTGAIEEVLSSHPAVAECAVFGVIDQLKGELPLGLVILKTGVTDSEDKILTEIIQRARDQIGPVAAFKQVAIVNRLPKTRSGKILRGIMKKIANGETFKTPATIDDPAILDEVATALIDLGYPKTA